VWANPILFYLALVYHRPGTRGWHRTNISRVRSNDFILHYSLLYPHCSQFSDWVQETYIRGKNNYNNGFRKPNGKLWRYNTPHRQRSISGSTTLHTVSSKTTATLLHHSHLETYLIEQRELLLEMPHLCSHFTTYVTRAGQIASHFSHTLNTASGFVKGQDLSVHWTMGGRCITAPMESFVPFTTGFLSF